MFDVGMHNFIDFTKIHEQKHFEFTIEKIGNLMQEIAQDLKEEARAEEKAPVTDDLEDSIVESEILDYEGNSVVNNFGCKKCEESYIADERKPLVLGCGQLSPPSAVSNYSF